ncbi:MAG: glycan-binding surface protein [Prevotellaceae bacterium]|nr:glycan-binding surface protein [Prevotellaceae bacterium]
MKNINLKNIRILAVLLFAITLAFSCKEKDEWGDNFEQNSLTPIVEKVFLEDARSSIADREVTFARLGQTIRLEGNNFLGVTKVYINGYECSFNTTLMSNISMIVQISSKVPTIDADADVRNTIRVEKGNKYYIHPFEIRSAAPSITGVSHTMPQAGDVIIITGSGLQEVSSVEFPGGIRAAEFSDSEDGTTVTVTVPDGIDKSGHITVVCANGGAHSPAYFNFKEGLLHNFDDVQNYAWGSGIDNTALTATVPATGNLPKSQGGYQVFNVDGNLAAAGVQKFWLNSNNAMTIMGALSGLTPVNECAIQMDIYVEGEWNSGFIRFVMADGAGDTKYCKLYEPVYVGGAYNKAAFVNPNCWFTITLPLDNMEVQDGVTIATLGDLIAQMSKASYKQMGPHFVNDGIKDVFDAVAATQKIHFDNIRVVPLAAPAYSDFPDEEEAE